MTLVILMLLLVLFMVFGRSFSSECPVAPPQQTTTRVLHAERLAPFMDPAFFAHLQIRYYNGDVGSCSGSLIAPSLILTAAHCVKNAYPNGWNVYTNIRDNHPVENGTRRQVSDFHVHPLFKLHGNQAFDMAIVQTDSPFKDDNAFTRFPRPRENNARLEQLGICQLTGSGLTLDNDGNTCVASKIRRHTTGIIIASACCNDALTVRLAIPQPQPKNPFESVCLRNLTDMACSGDSGGPVICRSPFTGEYMLMGILRAGPLCCSDKKPYHILNAPIERNILRLNGRRLSWILHAIRLLHKPRTDEDNDSVPLEFRRNWTENPRHDDYM